MECYNPFTLEGKTILVTGASSGIGRATAIECSKMGAKVVLTARNFERLRETHEQLTDAENQPNWIVADIQKDDGIQAIIENTPVLDGVVCNAGISINVPIAFIDRNKIQQVLDVNTIAPILLLRQLIKRKKVAKGGSIVFTSSVSGNNTVTAAHEIYSTSKAAITGFMRNAALDLAAKDIRCNAVHPGMVNTTRIHNGIFSKEQLQKDMDNYPLRRYGEPEEVAYAMIYLLSDAASWVTGHSLVIDGGLTLK